MVNPTLEAELTSEPSLVRVTRRMNRRGTLVGLAVRFRNPWAMSASQPPDAGVGLLAGLGAGVGAEVGIADGVGVGVAAADGVGVGALLGEGNGVGPTEGSGVEPVSPGVVVDGSAVEPADGSALASGVGALDAEVAADPGVASSALAAPDAVTSASRSAPTVKAATINLREFTSRNTSPRSYRGHIHFNTNLRRRKP